MRKNNNRCYSLRVKLEKLKQKTWVLIVLARFLLFLVTLADHYLRQG